MADLLPLPRNPEIDRLRAMANPVLRCSECHIPIRDAVMIGDSRVMLCKPCYARHRLHCDVCGNDETALTTWCSDGTWRCAACSPYLGGSA
jgi:hypothetical protein